MKRLTRPAFAMRQSLSPKQKTEVRMMRLRLFVCDMISKYDTAQKCAVHFFNVQSFHPPIRIRSKSMFPYALSGKSVRLDVFDAIR